jgi:hypothetical protein
MCSRALTRLAWQELVDATDDGRPLDSKALNSTLAMLRAEVQMLGVDPDLRTAATQRACSAHLALR